MQNCITSYINYWNNKGIEFNSKLRMYFIFGLELHDFALQLKKNLALKNSVKMWYLLWNMQNIS